MDLALGELGIPFSLSEESALAPPEGAVVPLHRGVLAFPCLRDKGRLGDHSVGHQCPESPRGPPLSGVKPGLCDCSSLQVAF